MPEYVCPICERPVRYAGQLPAVYPFCSERCKLVDLSRWLNEQYTIDRDLTPDDAGDGPERLRRARLRPSPPERQA